MSTFLDNLRGRVVALEKIEEDIDALTEYEEGALGTALCAVRKELKIARKELSCGEAAIKKVTQR